MTTLRLHDILIKCHVCGKAIEAAPDRQDVRTAELPNLAAQAPSPQALGPKVTHYTLSDVKPALLIQARKENGPEPGHSE